MLEAEAAPDLFNAVLDDCELVLSFPERARSLSTAISTREGVCLRLPGAGHPPYRLCWSSDGPRIEVVFPHD